MSHKLTPAQVRAVSSALAIIAQQQAQIQFLLNCIIEDNELKGRYTLSADATELVEVQPFPGDAPGQKDK